MKLISSVNVVLCSNIYDLSCYECVTQSCCKVGTGFKDEDLLRLNENMKALVVPSGRKPFNYNVGDPLTPDDWFEASALWELQAADLSKSRCVCVCVSVLMSIYVTYHCLYYVYHIVYTRLVPVASRQDVVLVCASRGSFVNAMTSARSKPLAVNRSWRCSTVKARPLDPQQAPRMTTMNSFNYY